jgi:hypothetical protein
VAAPVRCRSRPPPQTNGIAARSLDQFTAGARASSFCQNDRDPGVRRNPFLTVPTVLPSGPVVYQARPARPARLGGEKFHYWYQGSLALRGHTTSSLRQGGWCLIHRCSRSWADLSCR